MLPLVWSLALAALPAQDTTLTLPEAARRVLAVHPSARASAAAVASADAGRREARAGWFPSLTTSGSVTQFQEPMIVAPIHALDAAQIRFDRTLVQGDLALEFTVFDGGARAASVRAAGAAVRTQSAAGLATEADLLRDLTARYLATITASEVLAAQRDGARALEAERARVGLLVTEGAAPRVDLLRVEAALARVTADVARAEADLMVAARGLARTLDLDSIAPGRLRPVGPAGVPAPPREALLARMDSASPDLATARGVLAEAREARSRARAAWLPRLDVQGAVIAYGDGGWHFSPEWRFGARVFYPLFTGGGRSAAVARTAANEEAAAAGVRETEDRMADALDRALGSRSAAAARVVALEASTTHLAEVARIEALALEAGTGIQAEYLRAEAAARAARAELATARAALVLADVDLARVTGDLTVAWLAATLETP